MGTPAEEEEGAKVNMIDANVFDDIDVAMMAHGYPSFVASPKSLALEL